MQKRADKTETRRDFLCLTACAMATFGLGAAIWPLIDSLNPAADVIALASVEVDLESVRVGQRITVKWHGVPVYISHRTEKEIAQASAGDKAELIDPQPDSKRVKRKEWLIVVGVCTHAGCAPLGQKHTDPRGEYNGYFCHCHGSLFDTSGRVRKGPAPKNLQVPEYTFLSDTVVRIG